MPELLSGIERAYRMAVVDTPYCSISVKSLCEKAGVTRKAFYKHFGGKSDVLRAIIERDVVKPQVELIELLSFDKMRLRAPQMEEHMFQAFFDDKLFYRNLVSAPQGGREAFLEAASEAFAAFNARMLIESGMKSDSWRVDYAADYFAYAKAHYCLNWIEGDFTVPVEDVSGLYSRMALPYWGSIG